MAYEVTVGDRVLRAEVEALPDGGYAVLLDGERHEVDARFPEPGVVHMLHAGRSVEASVASDDLAWEVQIGARSLHLQVLDERRKAMLALHGGAQGAGAGEVISTSMPGKVVALLVQEGEAVSAGQGVVVVEAMKMENELKAAHDGVVRAVHVQVGEAVEGGAALVTIDPPEES